MQQVWVHYELWEEYYAGMWRNVYGEERKLYLKRAIKFTGNAKLYGKWMMIVVKKWVYSCLHNLSNQSINHQAWIGHSACCLAIGCPEDITRLAWHRLTQQQQDEANAMADKAIAEWERMYSYKGIQLCLKLN